MCKIIFECRICCLFQKTMNKKTRSKKNQKASFRQRIAEVIDSSDDDYDMIEVVNSVTQTSPVADEEIMGLASNISKNLVLHPASVVDNQERILHDQPANGIK